MLTRYPRYSRRFVSLGLIVSIAGQVTCQSEPSLPQQGAVSVAVGDVDGDEQPDIVFAVDGAAPVVVVNQGMTFRRLEGAFADPTSTEQAVDVRALCLSDFDGDGDLDLALACYRQPNVVCYNDGAGKFLTRVELGEQREAWTSAVGTADLDRDGRMDLVFGTLDRGLECWLQVGKRRWWHAPSAVPASKDRTACLVVGDLDADGVMDIVSGNQPDASKRGGADLVFIGTGKGGLVPAARASSLGRFTTASLALADLDADGDLDLVAAHTGAKRDEGARNTVHVYNDKFGRGVESRMPGIAEMTRAVAVGDLDLDGDIDIAFGNDGRDRLMLNDGEGRFESAPALALPQDRSNSVALALVDLDGDTDLDLVVASRDGPSSLLLNDGEGRFSTWEAAVVDAASPSSPSASGEAGVASGLNLIELVGQVEAHPTSPQELQRATSALFAIGQRRESGAPAMADLCDLLRSAFAKGFAPMQRSLVEALIETIGDVAPYADLEAVDARTAIARTVADYGGTRAFARTWTRIGIPHGVSTAHLLELVGDANPFASECAFELYGARGAADLKHAAKLQAGLSRIAARVSLDVPGKPPFYVDFPDPPDLTRDIATFLLDLDPTNRAATLAVLRLATDRWHSDASEQTWVTASAVLEDLDANRFDPEIHDLLLGLLASSKSGRRHVERERKLLYAALEFTSRSVGNALKSPQAAVPSNALERHRLALAWVSRSLLSDANTESAARAALDRIAREAARTEFEPSASHQVPKSLQRRSVPRKPGESIRIAEAGLEWLARNQSPDGRWHHDGTHDCGISALAVLVFLGEGITHLEGEYSAQVANGLRWLLGQQGEDGVFGTQGTNDYIYAHAIGTLAVAEAWALTGDPMLADSVRRASAYLLEHRNPYAVWRYQPRDNDGDTSVTTWCAVALAAVRDAGLEIPQDVFDLTAAWYREMLDADTGRVGYTERGGGSSRTSGDHAEKFPREQTEAMTAAAMFGSIRAGEPMTKNFPAQLQLVLGQSPSRATGSSLDYYFWFWGSHAVHQLGGKEWALWQRALVETLGKLQRDAGSEAGSFDPISVWSGIGGRCYATSMALLALQADSRWAVEVPSNWRGSVR